MKDKEKKQKTKKQSKSLPLLYVFGLPIILIVSTYIAHIHFTILGSPFYLSVLIYPLTYLITCLVVKKSNLSTALDLMAVSIVCQAFTFVVIWSLIGEMDSLLMICTFLSFVLNQLIIIVVYNYLLKTKMDTYLAIFILIVIVSGIDNILFGGLIEGETISLSILARLMYAVIIPAIVARSDSKKSIKNK
jgi:uncharacterized PurR-regulated membrane protein YhhQ (DUF165 family)